MGRQRASGACRPLCTMSFQPHGLAVKRCFYLFVPAHVLSRQELSSAVATEVVDLSVCAIVGRMCVAWNRGRRSWKPRSRRLDDHY